MFLFSRLRVSEQSFHHTGCFTKNGILDFDIFVKHAVRYNIISNSSSVCFVSIFPLFLSAVFSLLFVFVVVIITCVCTIVCVLCLLVFFVNRLRLTSTYERKKEVGWIKLNCNSFHEQNKVRLVKRESILHFAKINVVGNPPFSARFVEMCCLAF